MKAIIIAGGRGERLRPLTDVLPKPMLEIAGKPILEHIIALFKKNEIYEFIITLCYLSEKITDYFGSGEKFGVSITYLYEDVKNPLGTAGNIVVAKPFIDDVFIVTYADILRELDIMDMIAFHKRKKAFATLNIYKRFGDHPKSAVSLDEGKKIISFIERPELTDITNEYVWANGAFYIFEADIFSFLPENISKDFGRDIFPMLLKKRKALYGYQSEDYFIDIGDKKKFEKAKSTYTSYLL